MGAKDGRCLRLTILPPSCAVVTKSGSLNFVEPSGPVQACNKTALLCVKEEWTFLYCFFTVTISRKPKHSHVISWSIFAPHLDAVAPLKYG